MGMGMEGFLGQNPREIVLGPQRVGSDPRHSAGDADDQVVGVAGEQAGKIALGFGAPAQSRPGFAQGREDDEILGPQLDGTNQVVLRSLRPVQLELDHPPVDQRLDELVIELERAIVGIVGVHQLAGLGQGQSPVEVRPGELGPASAACAEVAGGLDESTLSIVAMPRTNQAQNEVTSRSRARLKACSAPAGSLPARSVVPSRVKSWQVDGTLEAASWRSRAARAASPSAA